jgi:SAM-dependent methyltransferase
MSNKTISIASIITHYEQSLQKYGNTPKGVDWPNANDLSLRFSIMVDLFKNEKKRISLLDLGCGIGLLLKYMTETHQLDHIDYSGIDISPIMVERAKALWPDHTFIQKNILTQPFCSNSFDYILMNGVLTEKQTLSYKEMASYSQDLIKTAFKIVKKGLAFNVMSPFVTHSRIDLFHYDVNEMIRFLTEHVSRHIQIRMDYGLYEYMVYVYKNPVTLAPKATNLF